MAVREALMTVAVIVAAAHATAGEPIKVGRFLCLDGNGLVRLHVKRHPTKSNKIILNWTGRDRVLHEEPTATGAIRFEGKASRLVYLQIPSKSLLLDNHTMRPLLNDCIQDSNQPGRTMKGART